LIQALRDDNGSVRESAAKTLGNINDTRAVEPLIQVLSDNDSVVRDYAAQALGDLGDTMAVKPLIQALKDVDQDLCAEVMLQARRWPNWDGKAEHKARDRLI
jgi:HEAT repeat protein